jgi:hypothetical protein
MNARSRPIRIRLASIVVVTILALMFVGGVSVAIGASPAATPAVAPPAIATPVAAPPVAAPPRCDTAPYRQFDFWAGDWDVTSAGDGSAAGTNNVTLTLDGCVLQEHWRGAGGSEGTSFNIWDRADARWHQVWVDNHGTRLDLAGGLRDGSMVLEGPERKGPRGGTVRDRITWTPMPDGRVRQHWEQTRDGGATWTTVFDGLYKRRAGA